MGGMKLKVAKVADESKWSVVEVVHLSGEIGGIGSWKEERDMLGWWW